MTDSAVVQYRYGNAQPTWSHSYLWPLMERLLRERMEPGSRLFELGCGNGATAEQMRKLGFEVTGVDPSETGISAGREAYPELALHVGSAYDDLAAAYGRYPVVVSLEVIEHCFRPRKFAQCVHDILEPGGAAIISTPYHGYWKNLALAITGQWDRHLSPLWEGGHIKFFSERTLRQLFSRERLECTALYRVGRIRPLAKSMVAVFRK